LLISLSFIWKSKLILILAASSTWIAFTYLSIMATFGTRAVVISIVPWGRQKVSDIDKEFYGRVFGALTFAFMTFMIYEMFHGGLHAAYTNFGR
jgi:hypothetical protein